MKTPYRGAPERYAFDESQHPRGQPQNSGEFAPSDHSHGGQTGDDQKQTQGASKQREPKEAIAAAKFTNVHDEAAIKESLSKIGEFDPSLLNGLNEIQGREWPTEGPWAAANATYNPQTGIIYVPTNRTPDTTTLAHELTHARQKAEGKIPEGGRMAMDPDAFNALETEAVGTAAKFDRWQKGEPEPSPVVADPNAQGGWGFYARTGDRERFARGQRGVGGSIRERFALEFSERGYVIRQT